MRLEETLLDGTSAGLRPMRVAKHNVQVINRNVIELARVVQHPIVSKGAAHAAATCSLGVRMEQCDPALPAGVVQLSDLMKTRLDSEVVNRNLLCIGRALDPTGMLGVHLLPCAGLCKTTLALAVADNLSVVAQNVIALGRLVAPKVVPLLDHCEVEAGAATRKPLAVQTKDYSAVINTNLLCITRAVGRAGGEDAVVVRSQTLSEEPGTVWPLVGACCAVQ